MLLRTPVALSIVGWVLLGNAGAAQQHPSFKTLQDVDAFTQTYYQKPRPELIASLIEALYSSGLTQRPNAAHHTSAFLAKCFW